MKGAPCLYDIGRGILHEKPLYLHIVYIWCSDNNLPNPGNISSVALPENVRCLSVWLKTCNCLIPENLWSCTLPRNTVTVIFIRHNSISRNFDEGCLKPEMLFSDFEHLFLIIRMFRYNEMVVFLSTNKCFEGCRDLERHIYTSCTLTDYF